MTANLESGFDPALYIGATNIIVAQSVYPSDYRWNGASNSKLRPALRTNPEQAGTYAVLGNAQFPWVNMHDRYFEDGIGGAKWWGKTDPLKADWIKETPWRVSVLNPNANYFLQNYVLPLRFGDVLGFTKGGFVVGTIGVEDQLLAFSRAFRALPAAKFADLPGCTQTAKARALRTPAATWFYAVNTTEKPVSLSVIFDRAPGTVTDLAVAQTQAVDGAKYLLQLKSYELRSFKIEGTASPTSVSCEGDDK